MDNPQFNRIKAKHPDWSDEQIWIALSLDLETDNVIERAKGDIDPNDPDIMRQIIVGARNWLREVLPSVFAKVGHFFDSMITTIGEWIQKGLTFVVDAIAHLLGKD